MHTDTLSDLIKIHTEEISLADFYQFTQLNYGGQVVPHHIEFTWLQEKPTELVGYVSSSSTTSTTTSISTSVSSEGSSDESDGIK